MNILFVHDHILKKNNNKFYSNGGLSSEVLKRYLQNKEDIITVYTRQEEISNEEATKYKITSGKEVFCNPSNNYKKPLDILLKSKNIKNEIKKLVDNSDFAIIRIPSILGFMTLDYIRNKNKKYMVEVVACAWDAFWNHGIVGKIFAAPMEYITKKEIRNAENVIYVSRKFLPERYPNNNKWISCSDVELRETSDEILEKRINKIEKLNFNKKEIIIATIAAINVKYKGQQYIIKAMKRLKKQGYNIIYRLVGSGSKDYLYQYANKLGVSNSVIFEGPLEHDKVFDLLDDVDIYIQPSNQEGLCRSLIEAMSRGCPCIASSAGGNPELINEKYIFKKRSAKQLEKKIKLIFNKDNLLYEAKENFNNANQHYSNELLNKKRNKFYKEIINIR